MYTHTTGLHQQQAPQMSCVMYILPGSRFSRQKFLLLHCQTFKRFQVDTRTFQNENDRNQKIFEKKAFKWKQHFLCTSLLRLQNYEEIPDVMYQLYEQTPPRTCCLVPSVFPLSTLYFHQEAAECLAFCWTAATETLYRTTLPLSVRSRTEDQVGSLLGTWMCLLLFLGCATNYRTLYLGCTGEE